jgi:hypothetical protein
VQLSSRPVTHFIFCDDPILSCACFLYVRSAICQSVLGLFEEFEGLPQS